MRHAEGHFRGLRGESLYWQAWLPAGEVRAVLLVVHGLGEHGGRYQGLAERFTAQGYALYAPDHLGHGRSAGKRLCLSRFTDYTGPLATFAAMVRGWQAGKPLFLVGHSMGGLIAAHHLAEHQGIYAGALLSAPACLPAIRLPACVVALGRLLSAIVPEMGLLRLDTRGVTRDPAVLAAYLADPLTFRGRITARLGAELLAAMARLPAAAARITLPLLILQGGADRIVDPNGSRWLHEHVSSADRRLIVYAGLYHEVFNEPERERVLGDLRAWLEAHLPAAEPVAGAKAPPPAPGHPPGETGGSALAGT